MLRLLAFLLASLTALAQPNIAVSYGIPGTGSGVNILNMNNSSSAAGVGVATGISSVSVSKLFLYVDSVGSVNVDTLTAEVYRMLSASIGTTVTYTDASDLVNLTNHPFTNGDMVRFVGATSLPTGINIDTTYYVCSATANTFQIDDNSGCGSIVTDFSGNSGTQTVAWYIANSTTFTPSPATGATWLEFSSFSAHTMEPNTRYAVIMRNTEANPATDWIKLTYLNSETPSMDAWWQTGGSAGALFTSSARGLTVALGSKNTAYVELSNGEKYGSTFTNVTTSTNGRINGTREVGVTLTTPANIRYNIAGLGTQIVSSSGSTPPISITLKLYSVGSTTDTLIDSCVAPFNIAGVLGVRCFFATTVEVNPSTKLRVVSMATSNTGDASNYINSRIYTFRSGADFDIPMTIRFNYCASSCTTTANWIEDTINTAPFALLLDNTTPYESTGGGGSVGGVFIGN